MGDLVESLKFAAVMYLLTYVGRWMNGLTLLMLFWVVASPHPGSTGTTRSRSTTPWPRSRPSSRRSWTRPRRRSADQLLRSLRKRSRGEPKGQRGAPGRILYGFEDFN